MTQASEGRLNVERSAVNAPGSADHAAVVRAVAAFAIYEVSFYLAYRYGMTFSPATASPFWFPDRLLCAAATPGRWWWAFSWRAPDPIDVVGPRASLFPDTARFGQGCRTAGHAVSSPIR
jgi:hypothetical protein